MIRSLGDVERLYLEYNNQLNYYAYSTDTPTEWEIEDTA